MTTAPMTHAAPPERAEERAAASPVRPSLLARIAEIAMVGGLTPLLFLSSFVARKRFGLDASEYAIGFLTFHAAHVINDPHFSVTYLLFYKDARRRAFSAEFKPAQRARYLFAGFVVPLALAATCVWALRHSSAPALGALMELMFLLVGWHYVKQGFGVMTVLSARRGVRFSGLERAAILAHCYAGWAYAWASPAAAGREVESKGVVYFALAHPAWLDRATHVIFLATVLPLAIVLVRKGKKIGTPAIAMLASVWAWSIYSSIDPLVVYVVPALHSIQYLYVVWLLRRGEARAREAALELGPSLAVRVVLLALGALALGFVLFHGAPQLLDAALTPKQSRFTDLGPTPYFAAIYAFVNIHHYFMDFVIWRRDNPATRALLVP